MSTIPTAASTRAKTNFERRKAVKVRPCPLRIKNPNHYKKDGSCLCFDHPAVGQDDKAQAKVINKWKKHGLVMARKMARRTKTETL